MLKNPRVIGVKNSSMPIQDIQTFKAIGGKDTIVFNGPDEQFIGGFMIGAEGGIGGTYGAMPKLFLKALECFKKGDYETARAIQRKYVWSNKSYFKNQPQHRNRRSSFSIS